MCQVASLVPPILTCLIGRHLGSASNSLDHYTLRDLAASLLRHLCSKYSRFSHNLKPRLTRTCLKNFLDPKKPCGAHYGAILGLSAVGGEEIIRALVIPNLKDFEDLLKEQLEDSGAKKDEAEKVLTAIINVLGTLVDEDMPMMNGHSDEVMTTMRTRLVDKLGEIVGGRIADAEYMPLTRAVLDA